MEQYFSTIPQRANAIWKLTVSMVGYKCDSVFDNRQGVQARNGNILEKSRIDEKI